MIRDLRLDVLRVLSMLAVILIHITAAYENTNIFDIHNLSSWVITIINKSLFWCIPVFFMLSGALLLDKHDETMEVFYRKRIVKILVPTLFWSAFFLTYLYIFKNFTFFNIVGSILKGAPFYHLWFMYAIIGIYIFTPYLRVLLRHLSSLELKNLIIIIFIFTMGNNFLSNYFDNKSTIFSSFIAYIGFYLLGYYLYKNKYYFQKYSTLYGILFLISVPASSILGIITEHLFHINISINTLLIPFQAVMLYLYGISRNFNLKLPAMWIHLSNFSFGVYLVHPIFILLSESYMTMNYLIFLPLFFLFTLVGSYIFVYMLSKIKYLKSLI